MKIRTDFVTNSSSSSFVVFTLKLYKEGKELCNVCFGGGDRECGESVYAHINLAKLSDAKNVEELKNELNSQIEFSKFNYCDYDYDDNYDDFDDEEDLEDVDYIEENTEKQEFERDIRIIPDGIANLKTMPDTIYINSQQEDDYGNEGIEQELIYHYATNRFFLKTEGEELYAEDGCFGSCDFFISFRVKEYSLDEDGRLYYEENGERHTFDYDYGRK